MFGHSAYTRPGIGIALATVENVDAPAFNLAVLASASQRLRSIPVERRTYAVGPVPVIQCGGHLGIDGRSQGIAVIARCLPSSVVRSK